MGGRAGGLVVRENLDRGEKEEVEVTER